MKKPIAITVLAAAGLWVIGTGIQAQQPAPGNFSARAIDAARSIKQRFTIAAASALGSFTVLAQGSDAASLIQAAGEAVRHANYLEADYLYAKAVTMSDKREIAPALWYLGARAAGSGNRLAAEGFLERLLKVDPDGPNTGRALTWLANMKDGDPSAETLFQRALEFEEAHSLDTSETARSYAFLLKRLGRADESQAMEHRSSRPRTVTAQNGAATPLPPGVFRVGAGISAPSLLSKVEPQYTEEARATRIQGTTRVMVDIGTDGVARNFEVSRSLEPGLDQKAIDAIQQWRFKPGMKDGQPVVVRATIEVNFKLM